MCMQDGCHSDKTAGRLVNSAGYVPSWTPATEADRGILPRPPSQLPVTFCLACDRSRALDPAVSESCNYKEFRAVAFQGPNPVRAPDTSRSSQTRTRLAAAPTRTRKTETRPLGELIEREHAFAPLLVHDPCRIGLHADLPATLGVGIDTLRIAFDVGQIVRGRPEPGLLLLARRSPVGSVHHGASGLEMASER
jgi:hypothetical protein